MRTTIRLFPAALLAGILLAACGPALGSFVPYLGGTLAGETTAIDAAGTSQSSGGGYSLPFARSASAGTLTAAATAPQYYRVTFANGVVDASSITAGGILLYNVANAAAGTEPYGRGAAIPFTAAVTGNTSGGSIVTLAIAAADLPASTSDPIELTLAKSLTANGGSRNLDTDGDGVDGEDEDEYVAYLAVSGGTAPAMGVQKIMPSTALSFTAAGALVATTGNIPFTASDAAGGFTNLVDLSSGVFTIYKLVSGAWTAATPAVVYDTATGNGTITVSGWAAGDVYRLWWDRYAIAEKTAVRGYVHRLTTAQNSTARMGSAVFLIGATTFNTAAFNATPDGGTDYARWIQLDFTPSGASRLDLATVTTATVRVRDTTNSVWVNWQGYGVMNAAGSSLRFQMPATFRGPTGNAYSVYVTPGVEDTASPAVPFGDSAFSQADGAIVLSGTW